MRFFSSTLALAIARITMIATGFLLVPIALSYLGEARYGLWMAFGSSILTLASFADGGISNGLISSAARARQAKDTAQLSRILSSGLLIVTSIAVGLFLIAAPLGYIVNWSTIIDLGDHTTAQEATILFLIVIFTLCVTMPVNVTLKFRTGLGRIVGVGVWDTIAALSIIPAILIVRAFDLGLAAFVAAALLSPLVVKGIGTIFFVISDKTTDIKIENYDWITGKRLFSSGLVFFLIAMTQAIAINADQMIIAILSGLKDVTPYAILNRLYSLPYMAINLILTVLWPMFAAHREAGDYVWIKRTFYKGARRLLDCRIVGCNGVISAVAEHS